MKDQGSTIARDTRETLEPGNEVLTRYGRRAIVVSASAAYVIVKYPGTRVPPQQFARRDVCAA